MKGLTTNELIRRWALCRCRYARRPADPCRCDEAALARAAQETPEQTRRWERTLSDREPYHHARAGV